MKAFPHSVALAVAALAVPALLRASEPASEPTPPQHVVSPEGVAGFTDTPRLPGVAWHVHDPFRPQPPVVRPGGAGGEGEPEPPPSDAVVLFDGGGLAAWENPGNWTVRDGALEVGSKSIRTREEFGDCQLHLEWAAPAEPQGSGQSRGNSGVFLMGLFEVQILDSYQNKTYPDGQAAALYGAVPPLVNACREPGRWQQYDIVFRAPRPGAGGSVTPARVTLFHNGVLVQADAEFPGPTVHRRLASYAGPVPSAGPVVLQEHGQKVRFRNIWIRRLDLP